MQLRKTGQKLKNFFRLLNAIFQLKRNFKNLFQVINPLINQNQFPKNI